jgi:hypothetical protein
VALSADGITWTPHAVTNLGGTAGDIAKLGSVYAISATGGNIVQTLDPTDWTAAVSSNSGVGFGGVFAAGGGTFVSAGFNGSLSQGGVTNDLTTWTLEDMQFGSGAVHRLIFSAIVGRYVAVGDNANVSTRENSSTPQASPPVLSGSIVGTDAHLSWTASTIFGSTITNYQVWKKIDSGSFALLTTLGNVLAYIDSTTAAGHTYQYYVIAVPAVGLNSVHSNTVTETPGASGNTFVIQNGLFACNLGAVGVDPAMQGLVPLTGHTGTDLIAGVGGSLISGDTSNKVYAVGSSTDVGTGMVLAIVGSYAKTDLTSIDFVGNDSVSYSLSGASAGGYATVTDPGDPTLTYTWWNWYSGGGGVIPAAAFALGQQVSLDVNSSVITL